MNYECHITVPPPPLSGDRSYLNGLAKVHKFKTSQIDGDPVLGDKVYFYFTGHDATYDSMYIRMNALASDIETLAHVRVLRRKIEHIVFDDKAIT